MISDRDLDDLRPVLEIVVSRADELTHRWIEWVAQHPDILRTIPKTEADDVLTRTPAAALRYLLQKNIAGYQAEVESVGRISARRAVPLGSLLAFTDSFWGIVRQMVLEERPEKMPTAIAAVFDRLVRFAGICLELSYHKWWSVRVKPRIHLLDDDAPATPGRPGGNFHGLVGKSAVMFELYDRIESVAASGAIVLIVGETGTGKEWVAHAIHEVSRPAGSPFIAVNCAAIPKDLIESELFGYVKGAFSGANAAKHGLFQEASGGTLFLDEITEMSVDGQSKLLRVLQEKAARPVGGNREMPVDASVIASTNLDPEAAAAAGALRKDLYYRLQACRLEIPPLRTRPEDIPILVDHFIALFGQQVRRSMRVEGVSPRALAVLTAYPWPGNVRELANVIEGAIVFGKHRQIRVRDLPREISSGQAPSATRPGHPEKLGSATGSSNGILAELREDAVREAVEAANGNKVQAAKILGVSRTTLYAYLKRAGEKKVADTPTQVRKFVVSGI
ncbi:sigma-54-dependent Fis family transcriptional regulator [Candidatus Binatus sp.]|uniref:sigma-54 interaction domain-containing protein n=1 Tax=Candidatus Binatus sp. TaxID=2811406 RepID=UPI00272C7B42|nr:sigma 54-interacting transcriptional regulator [Candidatus Binatus sp.]